MKSLSSRRRHRFAGAVVLLVALVGTGFVYAALATSSAEAAPSAAPSQTVEEGKQLFLEGCSSCHGLNADGSSNGPTLIGVGAAAVDFQVGTGRMPLARPGAQAPQSEVIYTQDHINALAAYIASLGPGPSIPTKDQLNTSGANLAEGGELFRTNCAQCHNFAGKGGALTHGKYAPALTGVSAKHMYEAMLTGPQNMPVFSERTITPEQKQAIIKYIENTRARPNPGGLGLGRVGPVSEGLFGWVVGLGLLGAVAVWIGAKSS